MGFGDRYSKYEKPAAYAPPSGATRTSIGGLQPKSGRTGRESELSRLSHSCVDVMHAPPAVATPAPFIWKPVSPTTALDKPLSFAQKLPAYAPLLVQRALALGACSQEAEGRAGKASSPDSAILRADVMYAPPAVAVLAPFVWKPVSPTSSAGQAFAFRFRSCQHTPPF